MEIKGYIVGSKKYRTTKRLLKKCLACGAKAAEFGRDFLSLEVDWPSGRVSYCFAPGADGWAKADIQLQFDLEV